MNNKGEVLWLIKEVKYKLSDSQIKFLNDILDLIPTTKGRGIMKHDRSNKIRNEIASRLTDFINTLQ